MSAHYKWYPASEEVTIPWNARYSFPTQVRFIDTSLLK